MSVDSRSASPAQRIGRCTVKRQGSADSAGIVTPEAVLCGSGCGFQVLSPGFRAFWFVIVGAILVHGLGWLHMLHRLTAFMQAGAKPVAKKADV